MLPLSSLTELVVEISLLKLVFAIFYEIFVSHQMIALQKR